jgi:hypothetical protein
MDTGMPMSALVSLMPMPCYARLVNFYKDDCPEDHFIFCGGGCNPWTLLGNRNYVFWDSPNGWLTEKI